MLTRPRIHRNTNKLYTDRCRFQRINYLDEEPPACGDHLGEGASMRAEGLSLRRKFKELLHLSPLSPLPAPAISTVQAGHSRQHPCGCSRDGGCHQPQRSYSKRHQSGQYEWVLYTHTCTSNTSKCPVSKIPYCPGDNCCLPLPLLFQAQQGTLAGKY